MVRVWKNPQESVVEAGNLTVFMYRIEPFNVRLVYEKEARVVLHYDTFQEGFSEHAHLCRSLTALLYRSLLCSCMNEDSFARPNTKQKTYTCQRR